MGRGALGGLEGLGELRGALRGSYGEALGRKHWCPSCPLSPDHCPPPIPFLPPSLSLSNTPNNFDLVFSFSMYYIRSVRIENLSMIVMPNVPSVNYVT